MENLIYVTGFGPFKGHEEKNASWEAVKLLPDSIQVNDKVFVLRKEEVSVTYEEVNSKVPQIWETKPKLVIHCGVDHGAIDIRLEKYANGNGYCREDWMKKMPETETPCLKNNGCCKKLETKLNVEKIAKQLNCECTADTSDYSSTPHIGTYLCSYIYLNSLDICDDRTLFIHVPSINENFQPKKTSSCILNVIKKCVEHLMEEKKI